MPNPQVDPYELQRAIRGRLQRARATLADPHATASTLPEEIVGVATALQQLRDVQPLVAEVGDTLHSVADLVRDLHGQINALRAQGRSQFGETPLPDPDD